MEIYVSKDGAQAGPFPIEEVEKMVAAGEYSAKDSGWHEGLNDWVPLLHILQFQKSSTPPPFQPSATIPAHFRIPSIEEIAKVVKQFKTLTFVAMGAFILFVAAFTINLDTRITLVPFAYFALITLYYQEKRCSGKEKTVCRVLLWIIISLYIFQPRLEIWYFRLTA